MEGETNLNSQFERRSDIMSILSDQISREEVERALDSKLVKNWLRDKNKTDAMRGGFLVFGVGNRFLYSMAKFRLGIENKYGVGSNANVFWEASDFLVDYMRTLKENGLSAAIADKYDLSNGSEEWKTIMNDEPLFTDEEMAEIQKHIKAKGYEQFCQVVAAFPEDHLIKTEMERIMNYQNGDALAKAFILYDIATKRLRAEYEGDERFYSRVRDFVRSDGTIFTPPSKDATPKEGELEIFRWKLKNDTARDILRMIATTPLSEKVPLLEMSPAEVRPECIRVYQCNGGWFVKCKIDGRDQLARRLSNKDAESFSNGKKGLAAKAFSDILVKEKKSKGMKR